MADAADDMLAGVVLHSPKQHSPVDLTGHDLAHGQRMIHIVGDAVGLLLHVQNLCAAQSASVRALATALREKGGLIQNHPPAVSGGRTAEDLGGKGLKIAVRIV